MPKPRLTVSQTGEPISVSHGTQREQPLTPPNVTQAALASQRAVMTPFGLAPSPISLKKKETPRTPKLSGTSKQLTTPLPLPRPISPLSSNLTKEVSPTHNSPPATPERAKSPSQLQTPEAPKLSPTNWRESPIVDLLAGKRSSIGSSPPPKRTPYYPLTDC